MNEITWFGVRIFPQKSEDLKHSVFIISEKKEHAEKLRDLILKDRTFRQSPPQVKDFDPDDKNFNDRSACVIIFVSDHVEAFGEELDLHTETPTILILNEITSKNLSFLTSLNSHEDSLPKNIVGVFKLKNLISDERFDLEDAGNLIRTLKQTIRSRLPEPADDNGDFLIKPIEWKIKIDSDKQSQPLLTLFLDEPMRNFLSHLQQALKQMKEAYRDLFTLEIKDPENLENSINKWLMDKCETSTKTSSKKTGTYSDISKHFIREYIPPFQPAHILLEGETGVGKSFLRHLMANFLGLKPQQVAYINAPTLSKELLEVELFGARKGAYTGADKTRAGVLMLKTQGLIFLDEIGDVDIDIQPKLLQYLEDFQFSPVGCYETNIFSPTYFIGATNQNLKELIHKGKFREDLFFRFRTHLYMPALRERKVDLKVLISFLLQSPHINPQRRITHISYRAIQTLLEYDYRNGNFRELELILSEATRSAQAEKSSILLEKHVHKAIYRVTK